MYNTQSVCALSGAQREDNVYPTKECFTYLFGTNKVIIQYKCLEQDDKVNNSTKPESKIKFLFKKIQKSKNTQILKLYFLRFTLQKANL